MRNNVLCYFAPRLGTCVGCITLSPQGNLPTIKAANIQLAFRLSGVFPLSSPMMFVSTNKSNIAFLLREVKHANIFFGVARYVFIPSLLGQWGRSFSLRIASHQLSPPLCVSLLSQARKPFVITKNKHLILKN